MPDLPSDFPPLQTLDSFQHNLPLQLTSFIGREEGDPGSETPRFLGNDFSPSQARRDGQDATRSSGCGGVCWSSFPMVSGWWNWQPFAMKPWFRRLSRPCWGSANVAGRPILQLLTEYLRNKEMLLMLDNCEHLLSACAQLVTTLLQACPNLCILATSREALDIPGRCPSGCLRSPHRIPAAEYHPSKN